MGGVRGETVDQHRQTAVVGADGEGRLDEVRLAGSGSQFAEADDARAGQQAVQPVPHLRVLRHYDTNGLLPSHRLPNGYRGFPEQAIERVRRIRLLLGVGLDLEGIALLLPCFSGDGRLTPCDRAQERMLAQIADVDAKMAALRATRRLLTDELRRWEQE